MNRALKFTIWHGLATSLALHSAVALPFVVHNLAPPPDDPEMLVVELQGMISDTQVEEKVAQLPPDQPQQSQPAPPPPQEAPPPEPQEEDVGSKPPEPQPQVSTPPQPVPPPQAHQVQDPDEQQKAQILKAEKDLETDRRREYIKRLSKKVQANLVYQKEGRKSSAATVSFTVNLDGHIKPGSLAVTESSGQPKLDASALQTIRTSAPFNAPPEQMDLVIVVDFKR